MAAFCSGIDLLGSFPSNPFISRASHKHQPVAFSFELVGFSVSVLIRDCEGRELPIRSNIYGPSGHLGLIFLLWVRIEIRPLPCGLPSAYSLNAVCDSC